MGVVDEEGEVVDAVVKIELDLVEVAVVAVDNLLRYISLGDPVHILRRHVQGADDRVKGLVEADHDLPKIPLMPVRVGPGGQLPFHGAHGQPVGVVDEEGDVVDAVVQIKLDLVEVAVVAVAYLLRHLSLGDPVHILSRHVQGADDRVQSLVESRHQVTEVPLVLGRIGPDNQLPRHRRLGQSPGIGDQGTDGVGHLFHGHDDTPGVLPCRVDDGGKIPPGHFAGQFSHEGRLSPQLPPDPPGDDPTETKPQENGHQSEQRHEQGSFLGQHIVFVGTPLGLLDLGVHLLHQRIQSDAAVLGDLPFQQE